MSLDAINPTSAVPAIAGARTGAGSEPATTATVRPVRKADIDADGKADPGQDGAVPAAELESAREAANRNLRGNGCELAFEFDDASKRMIARLIDTKTKEVLRQYPSRQALAIARALAEDRSQGVLLQTNA
jgi:flagellar protein FlaG